jgi:hypothetical protein
VKHGWFDKAANGHDIYCDLDSLFGTTCTGTTPSGDFILNMLTSDSVYGGLAATIDGEAEMVNNTSSDVLIEIIRDQNNLDPGWSTALCADICLDTASTTANFLLPAGQTQHFSMHFYSDSFTQGQGNTKIIFRNVNDFSNQYVQDFHAFSGTVGLEEAGAAANLINIYPNPFTNSLTISCSSEGQISTLNIYSISGRLMRQETGLSANKVTLFRDWMASGIYFAEVLNATGNIIGREKVIAQ